MPQTTFADETPTTVIEDSEPVREATWPAPDLVHLLAAAAAAGASCEPEWHGWLRGVTNYYAEG